MKQKTLFRLAASALACLVLISSCGKKTQWDKVDLIPVKTSKEGNWSMMDRKGRIVYDAEFKNQPTASYNGYFSVEESDGYTLYKSGGKAPEKVKGCDGLKAVGYMEEGLIPVVKKNARISVVDDGGKEKFVLKPIKDKEVTSCYSGFSEGLLAICVDNDQWGYVDEDGKVVINPKFDIVTPFDDGLALAGMKRDSTGYEYDVQVINTKGETVFKFKEGISPLTQFVDGYIYAKDEDNFYRYDKKGEKKKLPSKVKGIFDVKDGLIIFRGEDDGFGLMTDEGEELIRPKYESLSFAKGKNLLAQKVDEDEYLLIDREGEVKEKIDYKEVLYVKNFGYLAKDGSSSLLLDYKFKEKCKEDIYDYTLGICHYNIIDSDYFEAGTIASDVVNLLSGDSVGKYRLGAEASQIFSGESPDDYKYRYSTSFDFDDLTKDYGEYAVAATGFFTGSPTNYDYDYYSGSSYTWDSSSRLYEVKLTLSAQKEWGKRGFEAMNKALAAQGYSEAASGTSAGNTAYCSLYKKGDLYVKVTCPAKSTSWSVDVFSKPILESRTSDAEEFLTTDIDRNGKIDESEVDSYTSVVTPDIELPEVTEETIVESTAVVDVAPAQEVKVAETYDGGK